MRGEAIKIVGVLGLAAVVGLLAGCEGERGNGGAAPAPPEVSEAPTEGDPVSTDPLERLRLPREFRLEQEDLLDQARTDLEENPDDPDALIWVGRRLGYLGRYQEAIEVFTGGTELHPDDARLYRHRGHRFISVRQIDAAVADLETAANLILGSEDAIEPDGLPNEFGIPTSTNHSNVWYHLGLAHYLNGDFERAMAAYQRCLGVSDNPDMLVATSNWLYLTLRRLGRDAEALALLEPITADMQILESRDYLDLVLVYKGELDPEVLLEASLGAGGLGSATAGYGIGTWFLVSGNQVRAMEVYREIVAGESVGSFGFIAAEAELRRIS